jgi:hypothetical protein
VTPEYAAFALQGIRLVEELLIQNESRGLPETGLAMLPISVNVVPIGRPRFLTEYCTLLKASCDSENDPEAGWRASGN